MPEHTVNNRLILTLLICGFFGLIAVLERALNSPSWLMSIAHVAGWTYVGYAAIRLLALFGSFFLMKVMPKNHQKNIIKTLRASKPENIALGAIRSLIAPVLLSLCGLYLQATIFTVLALTLWTSMFLILHLARNLPEPK